MSALRVTKGEKGKLVHEDLADLLSGLDLHLEHGLAAELDQRHLVFESVLRLLLAQLQQLRDLLVLLLQLALQLLDLLLVHRHDLLSRKPNQQ